MIVYLLSCCPFILTASCFEPITRARDLSWSSRELCRPPSMPRPTNWRPSSFCLTRGRWKSKAELSPLPLLPRLHRCRWWRHKANGCRRRMQSDYTSPRKTAKRIQRSLQAPHGCRDRSGHVNASTVAVDEKEGESGGLTVPGQCCDLRLGEDHGT